MHRIFDDFWQSSVSFSNLLQICFLLLDTKYDLDIEQRQHHNGPNILQQQHFTGHVAKKLHTEAN